jgi:hypothetical protein
MTGTERAAVRLALGVLRAYSRHVPRGCASVYAQVYARAAVVAAWQYAEARADAYTVRAIAAAVLLADDLSGGDLTLARVVRVRLALYLRAVLRADSLGWDWLGMGGDIYGDDLMGSDLGEARHDEGLAPAYRRNAGEVWWSSARSSAQYHIARPLWLDAPPARR